MTENTLPPLPPVKLAFILDGRVQELLNTDTRLAAIFLSEPIVVDITNQPVQLMAKYNPDNGVFTGPVFDESGNLID